MSDHLFVYFGPDFSATFSLLAITTTAIPKINVSQNLRFGGETRHMWVTLGCEVTDIPGFPQLRLGPLEFTFNSRETVGIFILYISNLWTLSANAFIYYLSYSSGLKAFGIFSIFYTWWCIFWALCIWILSVAFIHEWFDIKLLNNKCFIPFPGLRGIFLPQKETCFSS